MTPEPRIFSLWNSRNGNVATWSLLGSERSLNKEDPVPRPNMDTFRIDQSNPDRLEFLCFFACPLILYHNWPSSKTLQSNSPCQHYLMPLCSPQRLNLSRPQIRETDLSRVSCLPASRLSTKYIHLSFLKTSVIVLASMSIGLQTLVW
uniref:Uncharacterized protein n=1 Tax=Molossus molossus TaxID=27622 RepID=A0A7J8HZS0_MOLMO|nr:hypothetical protein HJG59_010789 [Molossus molossus]